MTLEEMETVINFDRSSNKMSVYTADPVMIRKLDQMEAYKRIKEYTSSGKIVAVTYEADKKLLTLRAKRLTRELTEEQRKILSDKMKQMRKEQATAQNQF